MDFHIGTLQILKMGIQLLRHRIQQYRLKTSETIVRPTTYGPIKGVKRKGIYDVSYYAFEGIPFAKPPRGQLRFRAPQPPEPWTDVLDCTNVRDKPLQRNPVLHIVEGSEDCLYLNVYVNKLASEQPLPVIVYIYGGGYQIGEASRDMYAPDYLMKKDIVFVIITYRLGAFGFLSFDDPSLDIPGNAALKDQLLALRWVKENIANFNGDPNNITLAGESAGACSTHFLMLTDKTRGLFHKAIMHSGTALTEWALARRRNWGYRLAVELGYKGRNNDKDVFQFILQTNPRKIPSAIENFKTKAELCELKLFPMAPVIEPYITEHCIIPKQPVEMARTAWSNKIPMMMAGNSFEGLFLHDITHMHPYILNDLNDCEILLPENIRYEGCSGAEIKEMAAKLKQTYFNNKNPSFPETIFPYLTLLSDKCSWHGIHRTMLSRLTYAPTAPTYLYRFDFYSEFFNHFRRLCCNQPVRAVCHGDDLSYFFFHAMAKNLSPNSGEYKTIERMIDIWTSFAAASNPNCERTKPTVWEPLNSVDTLPKCLNITESVEIMNLPEAEKMHIWDSFYRENDLF